MYLEGKEFKSIWNAAHLWAGYDPESTDPNALPDEVRDHIHWFIVGHFRGELPLRRKWLYIDCRDESFFNGLLSITTWLKLRRGLSRNAFDKTFLDSLRIARGELIRWCQKEFRVPPPFWMPETNNDNQIASISPDVAEDDSDKDRWYEKLTDRRKQIVASLEIAKRLWNENSMQTYEEILKHPAMVRYGYPNIFTLDSFKRWARPFASDHAKNGGRRKETDG